MRHGLKLLIAVFILLLTSVASYSEDLNKPYNPTRKEWLEISIFRAIKTQTDPWKRRIGFITWVKEEENTGYITLTQANGQDPIDQGIVNRYLESVTHTIEGILEKYDWSKDIKIHLQFI